jgi:hypothetical protein
MKLIILIMTLLLIVGCSSNHEIVTELNVLKENVTNMAQINAECNNKVSNLEHEKGQLENCKECETCQPCAVCADAEACPICEECNQTEIIKYVNNETNETIIDTECRTDNTYVLSLIRRVRHLEIVSEECHFYNESERNQNLSDDLDVCSDRLEDIEEVLKGDE